MSKDKVLVINGGSSSLKSGLYEMPEGKAIVNINIERIGLPDSDYVIKTKSGKEKKERKIENHKEAVDIVLQELKSNHFIQDENEIVGVGHRVLHGGEFYNKSVIIDEGTLNKIKELTKLGPLHHPGEIAGIESISTDMPDVPQVAVFDTAFHQTMPQENYMYPVPYSWYKENGVRKYGFHGTSHRFITETMQDYFQRDNVNLIVCHIGSGASISCIKDGKCIDTSMGLTPLPGLMMGTRSGDIDPSIIEYMCEEKGLIPDEVISILNNESGLLGIAGVSDQRDLEKLAENGNEKAKLALEMQKKPVVKYLADYYFELGGDVDAIIFTAGIGENSAGFREGIVNAISGAMNIELNKEVNDNIASFKDNHSGIISTPASAIPVMVIPTDEEAVIAKDTFNLCNKTAKKLVKENK